MMNSYFFVPADRLHKLDSILDLGIDYVIIDLEDAIKYSEIEDALALLEKEECYREFFIRIPLYNRKGVFDNFLYKRLVDKGYKKFVFPKLTGFHDFEQNVKYINAEQKIILLVEEPSFLIELGQFLNRFSNKLYAIALGSHDFMRRMGAEHTLRNLEYYRNMILLYAKSYGLEAIDIASMELSDKEGLETEIYDGFSKGFDAKFYIHPWQVELKNTMSFYTQKDLEWATKIDKKLKEVERREEFEPVVIGGEVIEKAHLEKVFRILKYFKSYETK